MGVFSLERMNVLLEDLNRPQDRLPPVIHIAGTNGKGSTAAFSQRLLESSGLSVHVHTSPHLVKWNERFRLGVKGDRGKLVEDVLLLDVFSRVMQAKSARDISVFEASVAAAFILFSEYPADCVIIETGLGGRLDATNIIERNAVSVITSISLDHTEHLGNTVSAIAREKSAIMKSKNPVVIGYQLYDEAREVLVEKAKQMGCPYRVYGDHFYSFVKNKGFVYQDHIAQKYFSMPSLVGEYQHINAATAICAVQMAGFKLEEKCINFALQSTQWFGVLQKITKGPLLDKLPDYSEIWTDGGHNPGAGLVISQEICKLEGFYDKRFYLVIGMLKEKNYKKYLEPFVRLSPIVLSVSVMHNKDDIHSSISVDTQVLMQEAVTLGLKAFACSSVIEALLKIREINGKLPPPFILIGGSLHLVGEVLYKNGVQIH
ncbi:bifunctional folylpolyglutamate synthase/dihydrofolate synthase [Candidatus Liberibacter africanus]|uniref:FolC bifunctional protein n=1 Tax=Candidatus Liberibacter africanus PTSAPSY TaxID=1277257 RepID=A0A0G3I2P1_LIBAF|nr:folylpolyglutamate synthase/dihydrofolate synthase family protein [Candidatus Liberibacter africanus]AKK20159.1 FolC bifunctional protein [Candidatus Liberibacter africanus PTSAPSY]QTP63957.1 bifunctional folylpolyglutamate synthase/dihydrofolate synthase [Candidatus Liberibacter africanus]